MNTTPTQHPVTILWAFSRPHTIIGSIVSIVTLFLIAVPSAQWAPLQGPLWLTLLAGICCNVFITGLNQLTDHELDKINKPWLPLASGALSRSDAWRIIINCLIISLVISFATSIFLGGLISVITIIGLMYSVPPIQLKRHHLPAALAITGVRGVLVNLGMYAHFRITAGLPPDWQFEPLWILTAFVTVFSISIAWFKDLPDVQGDEQFRFRTAPVMYSVNTVYRAGVGILGIAYAATLLWAWSSGELFLFVCHGLAALLFVGHALRTHTEDHASVAAFYKYFWGFFFWEYLVFSAWSLLQA